MSPRTDVYALGVMLYEALAGAPPFPDDAVFALFQAHLTAEPPPLAARGVAPRLAAIVARALAKDPAHRFGDAGELRRELAAATAHGARAPRRLAVPVAALALVALVAGVGAAARFSEPTAAPGPDVGSAGDPAPGYVMPPATATLDPNLERALRSTLPVLSQMPRISRIQSMCAVHQAAGLSGLDPAMRSYYQRYELLMHETLPGEDPTHLCAKP